MDSSIFPDKSIKPSDFDLRKGLDKTFSLWKTIDEYVLEKFPKAKKEWNYSGLKYGWSYRIKDSKRVIVYLLPRNGFFKVALVFGDKAFNEVMESQIAQSIKDELAAARKYAEGRGFRVEIRNTGSIADVKKLIDIKLAH